MITSLDRNVILAVDGGGSKTTAWVASVPSRSDSPRMVLEILGRGESGSGNPRSIGFELAFTHIESAIVGALKTSSIEPSFVRTACLSLAGAGRIEEQRLIQAWAIEKFPFRETLVVDDVEPLRLAAAYEFLIDHPTASIEESDAWNRCVTLVAGTGSMARGDDETGHSIRVGGWGYLLGDEGSGYAIGLAGLRSICLTHDRGEKLSIMQQSLMHRLELIDPTQLIGWIYQDPIPRSAIANLAALVLYYTDMDPIANAITEQGVEAMANSVEQIASQSMFSTGYSLALSGGVLRHHSWLVERLLKRLELLSLTPTRSQLIQQPIHGPLILAANQFLPK